MFTHDRSLPCLLLLLGLAACTPVGDDLPEPADEVALDDAEDEPALTAEQAGAHVPAATFEPAVDHALREKVEQVRAESCRHDTRAGAPADFVPPPPARGLVEPGYRVEEDQIQASRDAFVEAPEGLRVLEAPEGTAAAQQRYLAQAEALAEGFVGSPEELALARAELKERELGE